MAYSWDLGTYQVSAVKESQAEAAGWMVIPFSKSRDGEEEKKGDEERTVQEGGMTSPNFVRGFELCASEV